jgi:secreted PhoX family phosphatase
VTEDQRSVFVAVQHPGEVDGADPDNPASHWPDGTQPRPSVAVVWHSRNHQIGS